MRLDFELAFDVGHGVDIESAWTSLSESSVFPTFLANAIVGLGRA